MGAVTLLSLECESFGGRDLARKGVGVGDKCLVGVAGFNLAVWNVGERETPHEAWAHCHTTKRTPGVWLERAECPNPQIPLASHTLGYLEV